MTNACLKCMTPFGDDWVNVTWRHDDRPLRLEITIVCPGCKDLFYRHIEPDVWTACPYDRDGYEKDGCVCRRCHDRWRESRADFSLKPTMSPEGECRDECN
ncbi:hypothetical protein KAR91_33885 [Candidatus Pacearchaeota archaeon]|nr:hypothetical protein [Candidatus Pacearchaeota archaeon]